MWVVRIFVVSLTASPLRQWCWVEFQSIPIMSGHGKLRVMVCQLAAKNRFSVGLIDSAAPSLLTSISVSSWPGPSFNVVLPCIRTPCICKWWFSKLPGCLTISCDWYFIYSMVVDVRKNMILLFENKLSYIFCVVGAGVTNADGLSNSTSAVGWHVDLCTCAWYFAMCFVKFESTVVTFDSGVVELEINVWYCFWKCEKLVVVPLLKFSVTSQTLSLRHPTHAATSDPLVAQRLLNRSSRAQDGRSRGRSLWGATIPSTVNTAQNIHDFALWCSRFSVDCLLAAPMVVGVAFLMLKCISSYLYCQYDSLSIDKCSKIWHKGPYCEEMLTNEEFNDNYIYPLTITIKRNSNLSIAHS